MNTRFIIFRMQLLLCVGLLGLAISCKPKKLAVAVKEESTDQIIFMMFTIERDTVQQRSVITLIEQKNAAGTIKNKPAEAHQHTNYLIAELYRDTALLQTMILEHPLYKHVEFINEQQQFARKELVLPKAEFFVRFQSQGRGTELRVSEVLQDKEKTPLHNFKIK